MIIAVDASGGEYAPHEIVKGAIQAAREYEVEIALVGRKEILYVLAGRYLTKLGIKIIDASQIIDYHESPVEAIRHKPESSIVVGTNLVREGKAAGFDNYITKPIDVKKFIKIVEEKLLDDAHYN